MNFNVSKFFSLSADLDLTFKGGRVLLGRERMLSTEELAEYLLDRLGSLQEVEGTLMDLAVKRNKYNISSAARYLEITRSQLDYRLKKREVS